MAYNPAPGVQRPELYKVPVGDNYRKYGEQPGYVYVPQYDQYYIDPKQIKEQYKQQGLIEKEPTLTQTLLPIGAAAGVGALATEFGKNVPEYLSGAGQSIKGLLGFGGEEVAKTAAQEAATSAAATTAPSLNGLISSSAADGGLAASESANAAWNSAATEAGGGLTAAPSALSQGLGAAGAALGTYQALNSIKNKDPLGAGLGGAGAGLGINAMGWGLGPWGWAGMVAAPAALALVNKFLDKPSTRDIQKKHTKGLLGTAPDDQSWQNYVQGMRAQNNSAPPDPSKPFHGGQYASWDEYKKAGLDAGDLTGVYGNLKTFGPDWSKLNFDQQKKVTQGLIDAGLYNSKKGEVEVSDASKAKQIYAQILNGGIVPQQRPVNGLF